MKKFAELVPYGLLLSLCPYLFYTSPNIAQSVILTAVAGLCAYSHYLISKKEPDYRKLYKDELEAVLAEVKEIKSEYGKLTVAQNRERRREEFKF